MSNIHDAFPSTYLKAADLKGKSVALTIKEVKMETVGDDRKLVVYFKGTEKSLVLNKTNANSIAVVTGSEDTDDWTGKKVTLFPTKVEYQGKRVPAIRIEEPEDVEDAVTDRSDVDDSDIPF